MTEFRILSTNLDPGRRQPIGFVVKCLVVWAILGLLPHGGPGLRAEEDSTYRERLTALVTTCHELEMPDEARATEAWYVARDPRRYYLFLPPASDPTRPSAGASPRVTSWHAKFTDLRREQGERLFEQARTAAEAKQEGAAYRLLHEVLRENPDHAEARRILGYVRGDRGWRHLAPRAKQRRNRGAHPMFGWPSDQYWVVDSEHFAVTTNQSVRGGRQLADYLERVYSAWQQLFYEFWTVPGRLTARFKGQDVSLGPDRTFDVVLFKDRAEYVRQLSSSEPQIEASIGFYAYTHKTAFFYAGDEAARTTWVHEVTHQFFQESGEVAPKVGERVNFWVVEGVALYMESLLDYDAYFTVGGAEAERLQFARYRRLCEDYYVPLETLVGYGREPFQNADDLPRLYSQCAGLVHGFLDVDRERQRGLFIAYLRNVYRGTSQPESLAREMGQAYSQLDQAYLDSLQVTDEDLVFVDPRVKSLGLARTQVTDAGLAQLKGVEQLTWLDLSFTETGDVGLARFADATRLNQLSLEKTRLTAASMGLISGLRQLEELDLSQTSVTDDDLVGLSKLVKLKTLWLTGTAVTDRGLTALESLRNLEQLEVTGTAVTPDGLTNLKRRLPKLK
jgi:hypothetical protein